VRLFAAVSNGLGWSEYYRKAAKGCTDTAIQLFEENFARIATVEDAAMMLLKAFRAAHDSTTKDLSTEKVVNYWEVGTATLLAGLLLPIERNKLGFLCATVGDGKAFRIRFGKKPTDISVEDITEGTRANITDEDDVGGRLGPHNEAGAPDQRNMSVFYSKVQPGDVILMLTEGVLANYDAQFLGMTPKDTDPKNIKADMWSDLETPKADAVKSAFRIKLLERLLQKAKTPLQITQDIINHVIACTTVRRAFLEREGKTPPKNYVLYPGKLDHATVVCFTVTEFP